MKESRRTQFESATHEGSEDHHRSRLLGVQFISGPGCVDQSIILGMHSNFQSSETRMALFPMISETGAHFCEVLGLGAMPNISSKYGRNRLIRLI
jgi:hypothetical protein